MAKAENLPPQRLPDGSGPPSPARQPPRRPEDYLELLDRHPGARITTLRLLGNRTDDDNTIFLREQIQTLDDDGTARQVEVFVGQQCSCGRIIDQDQKAAGVCQICGSVICYSAAGGCANWCSVCGISCCPRDRKTHSDGQKTVTYCLRCNWRHYWRRWWGLPE